MTKKHKKYCADHITNSFCYMGIKKSAYQKASKNRNRIVKFPRHCDSGAGPSMKPA
jgi:hypothetical protein